MISCDLRGAGTSQGEATLRDEWWQRLVPDLAAITVPALICGSFSDNNLHSRGSFRGWEHISSPERFLYTRHGGKGATCGASRARRASWAARPAFGSRISWEDPACGED